MSRHAPVRRRTRRRLHGEHLRNRCAGSRKRIFASRVAASLRRRLSHSKARAGVVSLDDHSCLTAARTCASRCAVVKRHRRRRTSSLTRHIRARAAHAKVSAHRATVERARKPAIDDRAPARRVASRVNRTDARESVASTHAAGASVVVVRWTPRRSIARSPPLDRSRTSNARYAVAMSCSTLSIAPPRAGARRN